MCCQLHVPAALIRKTIPVTAIQPPVNGDPAALSSPAVCPALQFSPLSTACSHCGPCSTEQPCCLTRPAVQSLIYSLQSLWTLQHWAALLSATPCSSVPYLQPAVTVDPAALCSPAVCPALQFSPLSTACCHCGPCSTEKPCSLPRPAFQSLILQPAVLATGCQ
jgi:hypothetical protein